MARQSGAPNAHDLDLAGIFTTGGTYFFDIGLAGQVNDAGTEINDFADSPANPLLGLPAGQTVADQGTPESGTNRNVIGDPFAGFLNTPIDGLSPALNFNNYSNGIATITITAVPEPTSLGLFGLGLGGMFLRRRRS